MVTSADAGYGLVQSLECPDDFYGRIYNMGGGPAGRITFITVPTTGYADDYGNEQPRTDDIKALFLPCLRHRVVLDPAEELEGGSSDAVLARILETVEVPR